MNELASNTAFGSFSDDMRNVCVQGLFEEMRIYVPEELVSKVFGNIIILCMFKFIYFVVFIYNSLMSVGNTSNCLFISYLSFLLQMKECEMRKKISRLYNDVIISVTTQIKILYHGCAFLLAWIRLFVIVLLRFHHRFERDCEFVFRYRFSLFCYMLVRHCVKKVLYLIFACLSCYCSRCVYHSSI